MKRHNAKAIAAAVAIAAAAATAESKKKAEPTKPSLSTPILYVDVVKNMAKMESTPSVAQSPPKFTILHEDFPALPGTPDDLQVAVPDDWTAMISDDDDQDDVDENENDGDADADGNGDADDNDDEEVQSLQSLQSPQSSLKVVIDQVESGTVAVPDPLVKSELESDVSEVSQSSSESSSEQENGVTAAVAAAVAHVAATTDYNSKNNNNNIAKDEIEPNFFGLSDNNNNCSIFDKQFLNAGVAQRVWRHQKLAEAKANIGPPPGFENIKFYGRLRTNRLGVPLGGVAFNMPPPQEPAEAPPPPTPQKPSSSRRWHNPSAGIEGAYGLAGLANNLKSAQQSPQMLTQILGHDAAGLNVDAHCCACEANKLHASFAGPLNGGRCAPHEVNFDVPLYYRRAGGQDLAQPKMEQMQTELLFFFFYAYPGDMMQMLAAAELADRGWRFHIYERLWIRPQPDNPHYMRRGFQESGEYNYFNMVHWKILARHFFLQPDYLERTLTKAELREQYGYHPQMSFF